MQTITREQFNAGHAGMHVHLTCENHPDLEWSCKKIALSQDKDGKLRYNGSRNIFFVTDDKPECSCPSSKLYALVQD